MLSLRLSSPLAPLAFTSPRVSFNLLYVYAALLWTDLPEHAHLRNQSAPFITRFPLPAYTLRLPSKATFQLSWDNFDQKSKKASYCKSN
mmetsp:Transcript_10378/g.20110  ORF Transcript_10378/g.20110 Transcript_10378/m.20110 type:complete len:89 (+) Transcript_10378:28-294(+)